LALNLSCRWRGLVSLTLWPLDFQGDVLWNNKNCNSIKGTCKSKNNSHWSFCSNVYTILWLSFLIHMSPVLLSSPLSSCPSWSVTVFPFSFYFCCSEIILSPTLDICMHHWKCLGSAGSIHGRYAADSDCVLCGLHSSITSVGAVRPAQLAVTLLFGAVWLTETLMWDVRYSQLCCWGFRFFRMWHSVTGWVVMVLQRTIVSLQHFELLAKCHGVTAQITWIVLLFFFCYCLPKAVLINHYHWTLWLKQYTMQLFKCDVCVLVFWQAIRALCLKFPRKHSVLMNFLSAMLRDEGGLEYKASIADTIITIIEENPEAKETGNWNWLH